MRFETGNTTRTKTTSARYRFWSSRGPTGRPVADTRRVRSRRTIVVNLRKPSVLIEIKQIEIFVGPTIMGDRGPIRFHTGRLWGPRCTRTARNVYRTKPDGNRNRRHPQSNPVLPWYVRACDRVHIVRMHETSATARLQYHYYGYRSKTRTVYTHSARFQEVNCERRRFLIDFRTTYLFYRR